MTKVTIRVGDQKKGPLFEARVEEWSLNIEQEYQDTQMLGSTTVRKIKGRTSYTISFTAYDRTIKDFIDTHPRQGDVILLLISEDPTGANTELEEHFEQMIAYDLKRDQLPGTSVWAFEHKLTFAKRKLGEQEPVFNEELGVDIESELSR